MGSERLLRLGIAGLGSAGGRRLSAALADPRVRVVAVADPRLGAGVGKSFEPGTLLPSGIARLASGRELLEQPLDALIVSVPNDEAAALSRAALARGLHLLCEKPPARSEEELLPVLAAQGDRVLRYGLNHRLHDGPQFARAALPAIGRVLGVAGSYTRPHLARPSDWRQDGGRAGGGVLLDQGIHLLDLARWLLGPLTLEGATGSFGADPALELHVDLSLRTQGGVPVRLTSSGCGAYRFALELVGERGRIELRGLHTSSGAYAPETGRLWLGGRLVRSLTAHHDPSWDREMRGFVAHALDGRDDGHGAPADALALQRLVDAARAQVQAPAQEIPA